jgi:hypothetical protein
MPLQATSGAASYDAFGGGVPVAVNYIEDVFSTYLYTGNGSTQTITNGIDLAGKGGLIWGKNRSSAVQHALFDTVRGQSKRLATNLTSAEVAMTPADGVIKSFNSNGFTLDVSAGTVLNDSGQNYASWTFRKQPKFFDVVTYTGTGSNTTIAHNLGSVPGSIFVKRTDTTAAWAVYHRSLANTQYLVLNTSAAAATGATWWNSTTPTSSVFSVGTNATVNASGGTYVAYIFAHNAGGFGLTGTDNVISCGSYTGTGATGNEQTLGFEPQFLLIKNTSASGLWVMVDIMRKITALPDTNADSTLYANSTAAEDPTSDPIAYLTPTGFGLKGLVAFSNASGNNYIYIAIRRGPMKVPTTGTSVFSPTAANNTQGTQNTTNFPVDLQIARIRASVTDTWDMDRLRRISTTATNGEKYLITNTSGAEGTGTSLTQFWDNTGFQTANGFASASTIYWNFGRASSFFDIVCYTGNGTSQNISHNLTVAPELMIVKKRNSATNSNWICYFDKLLTPISGNAARNFLLLNATQAGTQSDVHWNSTAPTSSVFTVGTSTNTNSSSDTFVWYGFATLTGISKVGSYTGTGTTLQINCGFTAGARFVLIKRTDSTGDWYVWDTARGIVAGNDPYLLLNSTAAEVTGTDYVDTYSAGFELSSTAPAAINASGGTFIFLAIA